MSQLRNHQPLALGFRRVRQACLALLALSALACGDDEVVSDLRVGFDQDTMAELRSVGLDRYTGMFKPSQIQDYGDGLFGYEFAVDENGPICLYGTPFKFGVLDQGSADLLIYLQGGGACWSELCAANEKSTDRVPPLGWTDVSGEQNPFQHFNVAYVAYCDGSVFSGDAEYGEGDERRFHHGMANLSAAVDVVKERYPAPDRIVLAGSSAGGYGSIIGTALVRLSWPDTPLSVLNDAGLGLTNPARPETLALFKSEWKFDQFVPPSCTSCQEGQFSEMIAWALERDPSLRVGGFSSYEDTVIGGVFLGMEGADFKQLLLSETGSIHQRFPKRFQRFFIEGMQHTAAIGLYDLQIDGMHVTTWADQMINADPEWADWLEGGGL